MDSSFSYLCQPTCQKSRAWCGRLFDNRKCIAMWLPCGMKKFQFTSFCQCGQCNETPVTDEVHIEITRKGIAHARPRQIYFLDLDSEHQRFKGFEVLRFLGGSFLTTRGGDTARWCWFVIASNLFTLFGMFTCFSSLFIELWVDLAPCSPMKSNPMCHCCRMVLCASPTCAT